MLSLYPRRIRTLCPGTSNVMALQRVRFDRWDTCGNSKWMYPPLGESSRLGATAVVCDFNEANGGLVVEVTLVSISCDEAARRNAGILLRPLLRDAFLLRALPSPDNCCKRASLLPRTVCFFRAAFSGCHDHFEINLWRETHFMGTLKTKCNRL